MATYQSSDSRPSRPVAYGLDQPRPTVLTFLARCRCGAAFPVRTGPCCTLCRMLPKRAA